MCSCVLSARPGTTTRSSQKYPLADALDATPRPLWFFFFFAAPFSQTLPLLTRCSRPATQVQAAGVYSATAGNSYEGHCHVP